MAMHKLQSVQEHGYIPETQFGAKNQDVKSLGEHLPSMDRTLSPIPDTTEREEKKKKTRTKERKERKERRKERRQEHIIPWHSTSSSVLGA